MKADAIHGRVWLTTLGRDSVHLWSSGCGGEGGMMMDRRE